NLLALPADCLAGHVLPPADDINGTGQSLDGDRLQMTDAAHAEHEVQGLKTFITDWSTDQEAFKRVHWGKAMMWIFLLSDTFVFSCFLTSYMTVRSSTTLPWPNPSEVFALTIAGHPTPLLLIAIMTFILISSSGTMALAVNYGYRHDRR